MPYPFPVQRYRDFQKWIPESDIDGIDAKPDFFADVENIDFENGFIQCAVSPNNYQQVPTLVQDEVTAGYEILTGQFFRHSERGDCEFYALYKESGGSHLMKFFIKDDTTTVELLLDEQSSDITVDAKPTNISYNLVNDQLKINLNVSATYNQLVVSRTIFGGGAGTPTGYRTVILNLSLGYIDTQTYSSGTTRSAGWYLFPRWLGWTYVNNLYDRPLYCPTVSDTILSFAASLTSGVGTETITSTNMVSMTGSSLDQGGDGGYMRADYSVDGSAEYIIDGIDYASGIVFYYKAKGTFQVSVYDADDALLIQREYSDSAQYDSAWTEVILPFGSVKAGIKVVFTTVGTTSNILHIDSININYQWNGNVILLARYYDQQRAYIDFDSNFSIDTELRLAVPGIDWRVEAYELYFQNEGESIYYKVYEIGADSAFDWTLVAATATNMAYYKHEVDETEIEFDSSETLNFNYGLTGIKVFRTQDGTDAGLVGDYIYDEILYRGRVYYVKEDDKLYMSHISGTSLAQPDSFPYSEEQRFGYLITAQIAENRAIAVTPLDELVIITEDTEYVYVIQETGGTPLRIIKAINGGAGISSIKSILKNINGQPVAEVLGWINKFGLFIYGGGRNAPINVARQTHKNYWLQIPEDYKNECIGMYYEGKNEFWFQINDKIIIYELNNQAFKKYDLGFKIKEWIGIRENVLYILTEDGEIKKIDPTNEGRLAGHITTHYSTDTVVIGEYPVPAWEWQHKILQDVYAVFKNNGSGQITLTIDADENDITPSIKFATSQLREVCLSPLLVRYGKIRLHWDIPATTVQIKEFGYSFSVPSQGRGGWGGKAPEGIGQQTGGTFGVFG